MDNLLEQYKLLLHQYKIKFTLNKKIILSVLIEESRHMTVKEIYDLAKVKDTGLGVATVYRSINLFKEIGILKELQIEGLTYYELKLYSSNPLHIHFRCQKCQKILDINDLKINLQYIKLIQDIEQKQAIDISDASIVFEGICSNCK